MTKRIASLLIFALPALAQITWTNQTKTGVWPNYNGYSIDHYDAVSQQTWHYGIRTFLGTVSAVNGSATLTWLSGDQFSVHWQNIPGSVDTLNIGGTTLSVLSVQSGTQLTLTAAYSGTTGTKAYAANGTGIFSTDVFFYKAATNTFTLVPGGTGSQVNRCIADTPTWPGDRHPVAQNAIDTKRKVLWQVSGVNQQCNVPIGTVTATAGSAAVTWASGGYFIQGPSWSGIGVTINGVNYNISSVTDAQHLTLTTNAAATGTFSFNLQDPNQSPRQDMYMMSLNANPATNTWTKLTTPGTMPDCEVWCAMVYDPDDDVLFLFGAQSVSSAEREWIYCRTAENPTPGTVTAKQAAAGCVADTWNRVTPTGGSPPGITQPGLVYDTVNHKALQFGGTSTSTQNQIWAYDVPTKVWVNRSPANPPIAPAENIAFQPAMDFNPNDGCLYYHYASGTSPLDPATNVDAKYCYATNTWTTLGTGTGPSYTDSMVYDQSLNALVAFNLHRGGAQDGQAEIWIGTLPASISVPIVVQELLPVGGPGCATAAACGIARTNEPFRAGIPLPDSSTNGAALTSVFGLTGCSAGQFRAIGKWPSGRIKWLEVEGIVPSLAAGANYGVAGTPTCTLTGSGGGNFGGSDLATDNGATITVATGTATFTIKKANFNLVDVANVGATSLVATSSSPNRGLLLMGPASPATTCAAGCTTQYSSASDAGSTVVIEENGPVEAVLKATGALIDGASHTYLRYTVREHFWKNTNRVKLHIELRNADDPGASTGNNFASSHKGFASFEGRVDLVAGGTKTYAFGGKAGVVSGAFSGAEDATLVQLYSDVMNDTLSGGSKGDPGEWNIAGVMAENSMASIIPRSSAGCLASDFFCYPDNTRINEGYTIKDGATVRETGARRDMPAGWGNVENASGTGVLTGVWYLSAYWPKSLEFNAGGNNVVIGIWPKQITGFNWWIGYATYQITDAFLDFHATALASNDSEFKRLQYDLTGRAPVSQYNAANVFVSGPIPDAAAEDNFWTNTITTAPNNNPFQGASKMCCQTDSISGLASGPYIFRTYQWHASGGTNESEIGWAYLLNFIQRGFSTKYLFGKMRARFIEQEVYPRSDFGGWRTKAYNTVLNGEGFPTGIVSPNAALYTVSSGDLPNWKNFSGDGGLHSHIYGFYDWYFVTGEEHYRDTINQGYYDQNLNAILSQNGATTDFNFPSVPRAIGPRMSSINRLHDFCLATGDPTDSATGVKCAIETWNNAEAVLNKAVRHVMVTPKTSCTVALCRGAGDYGTDMNRGAISAMAYSQAWYLPSTQIVGTGDGSTRTFPFSLNLNGMPYVESQGANQFPEIMISAGAVRVHDSANSVSTGLLNSNSLVSPFAPGPGGTGSMVLGSGASANAYTGVGTVTFDVAPANGVPISVHYFTPNPAANSPTGTLGSGRFAGGFQTSIAVGGIREYAQSRGPSWSGFEDLMDLTYGMSENFFHQELTATGSTNWSQNGIYFGIALDTCNDPRPTSVCYASPAHNAWWSNDPSQATPFSTANAVWWPWITRSDYFGDKSVLLEWENEMFRNLASGAPNGFTEYGSPWIQNLVYRAINPPLYTLTDIPGGITAFSDLGGGNYSVSWTVPANCYIPAGYSTCYKFKYAPKKIVASMGFDSAETNQYAVSTATNQPWFSASNVSNEPVQAAAGTTQSYTFATATTGLTALNFSVKAFTSGPQALAVNAAPLPGTTVGAVYSQSIASWASGGTAPYGSWALASGALPAGLTLSGTGLISGTAGGSSGTFNFTVSATDGVSASATSGTASIVVNAAPSISTNSPLPAGIVGTLYSQTLAAAGGVPSYTWGITAGALPAGLALVPLTGVVSGTPTVANTSNFTVQATDSVGVAVSKALTLVIGGGGATGTTLSGATVCTGCAIH